MTAQRVTVSELGIGSGAGAGGEADGEKIETLNYMRSFLDFFAEAPITPSPIYFRWHSKWGSHTSSWQCMLFALQPTLQHCLGAKLAAANGLLPWTL